MTPIGARQGVRLASRADRTAASRAIRFPDGAAAGGLVHGSFGSGRDGDRIVTDPSARRDAVVDVIRRARRQLTLSVFRCTDEGIIVELARAVDRGVRVDVLVTSRSKGKKKLRRLWEALQTTGATLHAYRDPVVKYHAK